MANQRVLSVNISERTGTIKTPVSEIRLTEKGVANDAHAGDWNRQVSLLGVESITKFEREARRKIKYGEFAENITTDGITLYNLNPLDRLKIGESLLEVTQIGKKCHGTSCAIFKEVGNCVMPKEGIFCRVVQSGTIEENDSIEYIPKTFVVKIITMSDRASLGIYEDRSGPKAEQMIADFFSSNRYNYNISRIVIPDEKVDLQAELEKARQEAADIILTTGGTGIGARDITPEVVKAFIDKEIPGIMEYIRMKYGADKPNVLLSRSVAGVKDKSLVYAIPGSVKGVQEYVQEILMTLLHSIYMLHGLDMH